MLRVLCRAQKLAGEALARRLRERLGAQQPARFFDPDNPEGRAARRQMALAALGDVLRWLADDGADWVHLSLADAAGPPPHEALDTPVATAIREALPDEGDMDFFKVLKALKMSTLQVAAESINR